MKDAIVFDLDGTLWDTVSAVVRSWNEVLDRRPEARAHLTEEAMRAYMGKTTEQIAALMLPALPLEEALALMAECTQSEYAYLRAHGGGRLFPDLVPTLHTLCAQYDLFIVSNCQSGYIEIFLEVHGVSDCFRGHTCPGDTGMGKAGNIRRILQEAGNPRAFYLGDTDGDERAAREAGVPFVHAAYGFGHAEHPDAVLTRFSDLPALAARLFSSPLFG